MAFFSSAVNVLQTLVVVLGAGLGIWGVINLMEGYGNGNWISVTDLSGANEEADFDLEDKDTNVEEEVLHRMSLCELRNYMQDLPEEDRVFLYDCFSDRPDNLKWVTEKYGMKREQVKYRRRKLIQILRERFEGKK